MGLKSVPTERNKTASIDDQAGTFDSNRNAKQNAESANYVAYTDGVDVAGKQAANNSHTSTVSSRSAQRVSRVR